MTDTADLPQEPTMILYIEAMSHLQSAQALYNQTHSPFARLAVDRASREVAIAEARLNVSVRGL